MSLTNEQNNFLRCICDVLGFEHPDNLSDEQEEALLDCFKTLTTTKEKTKTKTKTKADTKTKQGKPGNVWITWLQLNRDAIKSENGGENGLVAILSERYAVFKKTSAFKKLQEKCKEKMKRYTESLKTDKEKNEREMARRKAYYNNVVKPQKEAIKQQKKDEMDKVKAEAKKCILEIEWDGEGNTPIEQIYIS